MSERPPRFLVVAPSWVGDAVMATPVLASLKKSFPGCRVTVLSKKRTLDIFSMHPLVDETLQYGPGAGVLGSFSLALKLRKAGFEKALVLPNSFRSAILPFLAGVPERVGYSRDLRRPLLTRALEAGDRLKTMHQADYYLDLAGAAGAGSIERKLGLGVSDLALGEAKKLLGGSAMDAKAPLVGLHPGAAFGPAKRWPLESYASLINRLSEKADINVVLLGSPDEAPEAARLSQMLDKSPVDLTGKTTLAQAIATISLADLFISNDSGLMHVAAALARPQVALFGSTEPRKTAPLNERAVLIRHQVECSPCFKRQCPMPGVYCWEAITVDEVLGAALGIIERP